MGKPTDDDRYAGSVVREYRKKRSVSQEQLAEIIGLSFQQVQKYETGLNRMSIGVAKKICDYLRLSPSKLFRKK